MNSGKEQIIDLAASRTRNAQKTAANNMSLDIYSSGSLSNQMGGLGALITTDGTGTVGGISTTGNTWWKNQFQEVSGTGAPYAGIKDDMMKLWLACVRGGDKPDLIVMTNDFWAAYWSNLTSLQRYTDTSEAGAGIDSVKFQNADVVHDLEATNFTSTGEIGYFLNTDYLELVVHRDANWTTLDEKMSINQDAVVIPLIWQGQLVTSNRSLQGRLLDAS
jgi:hypothetical protein